MVFPPRSCNTPASRVLCSARCWPRWVMDWSYPRCRNWGWWWWWWWWWWSSDHLIIWRLMIIFMTLIRINVLVAFAPLGPRSSVSPSRPRAAAAGLHLGPGGGLLRPDDLWRPGRAGDPGGSHRHPSDRFGQRAAAGGHAVGGDHLWSHQWGLHECDLGVFIVSFLGLKYVDTLDSGRMNLYINFRLFFWVLHSSRRFQTRTLALESLLVPRQRGFWCCLPPPCGLLPWARGMRATSWCQWVLQRGPCFNPSSWWSWQARWVCFFWWFLKGQHNNTARRCVLPGKFTWRLSIIFQHAQTPARGPVLWDFPDDEP